MMKKNFSERQQSASFSYPKFGKRHIIAIWIFLGYVAVYLTRVSLNTAITSMVNDTTDGHRRHNESMIHDNNATSSSDPAVIVCPYPDDATLNNNNNNSRMQGELNWDKETEGVVLSSFYYGYICTQIIGGILPRIVGARLLFGIAIGGSGVATVLLPIAARTNVAFFVAIRVIAGVLQGVLMPCSHFLSGSWAPKKERTMLVAMPLTGPHIGTVLAGALTGVLCEYGFDGGWPSVFYIFGGICIIWTFGWFFFVTDTPAKHGTISTAERKYIEENCETVEEPVPLRSVPWLKIALSPPVWAIVVAQTFYGWNFDSLLIEVSTYLNDVLHITASLNGVIASIPYICVCIVELSTALLSDWFLSKGAPVVWVRKGFFLFGMITSAAALFAIGYVGCNITVVVVLLCLSVGLTGFAFVGFIVNHVDIAPQYAGILMGITNTFAQLPGIIAPLITGVIITNESTMATWQIVFYISIGITIAGGIIYVLFADGEIQSWAAINKKDDNNNNNNNETAYELEASSPPPVTMSHHRDVTRMMMTASDFERLQTDLGYNNNNVSNIMTPPPSYQQTCFAALSTKSTDDDDISNEYVF